MSDITVLERPDDATEIRSLPHDSLTSPAGGSVVAEDLDVVDATADKPMGIIPEAIPSSNPPEMVDIYGNGALLELTSSELTSTQSAGTAIYSDGSGGYQTTEPTADAWRLGHIEQAEDGTDSRILRVDIEKVEA